MSGKRSFQEIEIKLPVADLATLRGGLKRLRAQEISPRTHELNTLYDTPGQNLRQRGRLIRIRTEKVAATVKRETWPRELGAVLTYKGPARSQLRGRAATRGSRRFKIKEEAEVRVDQADQIDRILGGLGLHPTFHYEKYRTTYVLPGVKGVKIELDQTPIGNYVELEGSPSSIDRAAHLLGYGPADYIRDTYGALYLADCRRRGRKPGHMLFPKAKKLR